MKNINSLLQLYRNILLNNKDKRLSEDLDLKCFLQFLYSHITCECALIYKFDEEFKGEIISEYSETGYSVMANVSIINSEDSESNILRRYRVDDDYIIASSGESFNNEYYCAVLNDVNNDTISECYKEYLRSINCGSYIITGIYKEDRLWGLIGVYNQTPKEWLEEEIGVLTIYSFILSSILTYKNKEELLTLKLKEAYSDIVGIKSELISKELKLFQCEEKLEMLSKIDTSLNNLDLVTGLNTK
jgi:hypothetical protein